MALATAVEVLDGPVVFDEPDSIEALTAIANAEHASALESGREWFAHVCNAGAALAAIKTQIARGYWMTWLDENCDVDANTAIEYIRLYTYRHVFEGEAPRTYKAARRQMRGLPRLGFGGVPLTDTQKEQVFALRKEGLTQEAIAQTVGCSRGTVSRILNGEALRRRQRDRRQAWLEARADKRNKARLKRNEAAARSAGGSIWRAYGDLRRAQQAAHAAMEEATNAGQRATLGEVYDLLARAEDLWGKAAQAQRGAP